MYVLAKHKVQDYPKWKAAFDSFAEKRKSSGELTYTIYHSDNDSNDLTMIFEWDSAENAKKFMTSQELKDAMQQGGVIEEPQIQFLTEVARGAL